MRRRDLPEFRSLVDLLENETPAKELDPVKKIKCHPQNLLKIRMKEGVDSGYLLTNDGYFITNSHVLPGDLPEEEAQVYINKIPFPFKIVRILMRSRPHDLVLAQSSLNSRHSPTSVILAGRHAMEGELVRAYSFSEEKALRSHGKIVSYDSMSILPPDLEGLLGPEARNAFDSLFNPLTGQKQEIQEAVKKNSFYSTCTIEQGWSGGPVISEESGEVIGITKYIEFRRNLLGNEKQYHGLSSVVVVRKIINYFLNGESK